MTVTTRRQHRSLDESLAFIKSLNWDAKTVIDIGAAWGTPELLHAFPDAYHILIDPVPIYEDRFKTILKKYKGEYHLLAVSNQPGEMYISVPNNGGEVGSQLTSCKFSSGNSLPVRVDTLDGLFVERCLAEPILIKTDCQGYDMHCLMGGKELMKKVDLAICEVNMFHPTGRPDLPDFTETITSMHGLGFVAYDLVSYQTRPLDDALGYIDIVFASEQSLFRKHHRWA